MGHSCAAPIAYDLLVAGIRVHMHVLGHLHTLHNIILNTFLTASSTTPWYFFGDKNPTTL